MGERSLPAQSNKFSRKDYTLAQLLALLVLRKFFRTDYRGVATIVREWANCGKRWGWPRFPIIRRSGASSKSSWKRGFEELPAACCNHGRTCGLIVDDEDCTAAIDSTGLETRHASMHFQRRGGRTEATHAAWPKLTAVFHANSQLIVGAVAARGPSQDSPDFPAAVRQAAANLRPRRLLGDKGCDAEHNHALRRQDSAFAARSSRSIRETLSGRPRGAIAG